MRPFLINHMTVPTLSFRALVALAAELGCEGVEVRNDLGAPLFDGLDASAAGQIASDAGVDIVTVAEVSAFNDGSDRAFESLCTLAEQAAAAGARGVALIPRNDGVGCEDGERQRALSAALARFAPVLARHDVFGFVEPLGFVQSSLRYKREAVEAIEALGLGARYKLVHDTFHHHLASEPAVFAEHTAVVHVSGVAEPGLARADMSDAHRVLVDADDVLGNREQLAQLDAAGFAGPVSVEAFAPTVHALTAPATALTNSFHCMRKGVAASAA
ncbi:MAG: TIM barrel protein [Pseudomonadota bacterium]